MIKRLFLFLLVALICLTATVVIKTVSTGSRQLQVTPAAPLAIDENAAAQRLATALRFKTISRQGQTDLPEPSAGEFKKLHQHIDQAFPLIHAKLTRETVGAASLLYTWQGSDPQALPVMLMAHQDVVPVAPDTEQNWQQPPFDGVIRDGFIWGRGSWDDKGNLFAVLEAVEKLLASGFQPRQTIYLAFGHDEEVNGIQGAKAIASLLQSRAVKLDYVLDEGMLITEGILKGLDQPAALIGVAEKGYASFTLNATATPGHSSMPPEKTAIGMLGAALARLEEQQFPAQIRGVALDMFETIAPEMHGLNRVLLSNLWLFRPVVQQQLAKSQSVNATLRTTTALTMVHGGDKDNVLPGTADATVNFRTLPGDTQTTVAQHIRTVIANDTIKVSAMPGNSEPSPVSPTTSAAYQNLHKTIREVFPNTIVAPGLMLGATDSRHFSVLSHHIFKFSPVRAKSEDLARFHGTNERISVQNYVEMIRFYHQLLLNSSK
ncbi:M20 family peptidase [Undibacterium sp. Jales W-56]|uniref:M20 family peptidase n=1 Tax=Undibacterium sp. Jales W-56 TaxID=2897325 RepID=UPI0021D08325|nr:M20 family peptidase [Undibacterium sp. Jales W-56]MCU6434166.1 M20 family peptidase [Undibacterium sp. Jales W-56]